jgi:futalosine hydrolase
VDLALDRPALILVIYAVSAELRGFPKRDGVEMMACGIGPIEAAAETARMLAFGKFDAVINAGIAGAFRGHAKVGEAVIVREEFLADLGLEGGGPLTLPDDAKLIAEVAAAPALLARCDGLPYRVGRGLTVTQVTATRATADRLTAGYNADVESMEGFAVLRAAALAGVPALEVRGISNYVGDRAQSEWDFGAGTSALQAALADVLARIATR